MYSSTMSKLFFGFVNLLAATSLVTCSRDNDDNTNDRLLKLENTVAAVLTRNHELEEITRQLHNRIDRLEKELQLQRFDNDVLKNKVTTLERKNAQVIDWLTEDRKNVEQAMHRTAENSFEQSPNSDAENQQVTKFGLLNKSVKSTKRQLQAATVAFTATVTPPRLSGLGPGYPVIFDHVVTNIGDAYNNKTGIFTAPISGVYVFNMALMVEPSQDQYLEFVKDGQHVMFNYGHAIGAAQYVSSSRTTTLDVVRGEEVWIRTRNLAHHGTGIVHGNGFSTFSGWLLAITE